MIMTLPYDEFISKYKFLSWWIILSSGAEFWRQQDANLEHRRIMFFPSEPVQVGIDHRNFVNHLTTKWNWNRKKKAETQDYTPKN